MSDFSHYFGDVLEEGEDVQPGIISRARNISVSSDTFRFLQEVVERLVPSSYVYGESGIGDRVYELYASCVSHALTGRRSNRLLAALCIMHACNELRTDLVILPTDIESKLAVWNMSQIRLQNIMSVYGVMCDSLKLPRLQPFMEKVFHRVFRLGCQIESDQDIYRFVDTALRFEEKLRSNLNHAIPKTKKNFRTQFRIETIAAASAILALRYHNYTKATAINITNELNVSKGCVYNLLNKFKEKTAGIGPQERNVAVVDEKVGEGVEQPVSVPNIESQGGQAMEHGATLETMAKPDPHSTQKREPHQVPKNNIGRARPIPGNHTMLEKPRAKPISIGGIEVPSGVSKRRRSAEKSNSGVQEEVLAIVPAVGDLQSVSVKMDSSDPLSFLFYSNAPVAPLDFTTNPSPDSDEAGVGPAPIADSHDSEHPQRDYMENGGLSRSSGWSDFLPNLD